ncbi:Uncharacterised protein [Chlamydia trachomatis]|nr:Uncharacterised protein [Chlamydia trachomatis]
MGKDTAILTGSQVLPRHSKIDFVIFHPVKRGFPFKVCMVEVLIHGHICTMILCSDLHSFIPC